MRSLFLQINLYNLILHNFLIFSINFSSFGFDFINLRISSSSFGVLIEGNKFGT